METMAAPAAQRAAMAGGRAAELGRPGQAEAIGSQDPIGEVDRCGQPPIQRVGIVPGRIDMPLPGDHVVEAGAEPGIACPNDAILRGAETAGLRALVALRPIRHGARVGGQEGAGHPGALEDAAAQQLREAPSGALLQDVRQDPEILVAVGIAGAGRKLQRPGGGHDAGGFDLPERRLGRRTMQHRHGPVVAQTRLVVAEVQRAWRRLLQQRQAGPHVVIEHRRVGKGVQDQAAGELLGDGAHAKQRVRREGKAPFGIGPAPGVTSQHLAVAQYGKRTAGSGVVAGQSFSIARSRPPECEVIMADTFASSLQEGNCRN